MYPAFILAFVFCALVFWLPTLVIGSVFFRYEKDDWFVGCCLMSFVAFLPFVPLEPMWRIVWFGLGAFLAMTVVAIWLGVSFYDRRQRVA